MKRSRDGRCAKSQHIDVFPQFFDLFLMRHAKTLLLIDHQESQILEYHILRQHAVCADDDVYFTLFQRLQRLFLFRCGSKAGEHLHPNRKVPHAGGKRIIMLLRQNRRRHQHCHLFGILHGFEGGTDGDLRLAEADVAADETVHDFGGFHIVFNIGNGVFLILRFLVGKGVFKFLLPYRVLGKGVALLFLPFGIEFHQIFRNLIDGTFDLCFRPSPVRTAELI